MLKKLSITLLFISFVLQIEAKDGYYWGVNGHRIVGEIANSYLKRKAKNNICKILGTESIAITSNWADFIKSDTTMKYLDPWHYINVKSGMNYADFSAYLKTDTITDAYTKINSLTKKLILV